MLHVIWYKQFWHFPLPHKDSIKPHRFMKIYSRIPHTKIVQYRTNLFKPMQIEK